MGNIGVAEARKLNVWAEGCNAKRRIANDLSKVYSSDDRAELGCSAPLVKTSGSQIAGGSTTN